MNMKWLLSERMTAKLLSQMNEIQSAGNKRRTLLDIHLEMVWNITSPLQVTTTKEEQLKTKDE